VCGDTDISKDKKYSTFELAMVKALKPIIGPKSWEIFAIEECLRAIEGMNLYGSMKAFEMFLVLDIVIP